MLIFLINNSYETSNNSSSTGKEKNKIEVKWIDLGKD